MLAIRLLFAFDCLSATWVGALILDHANITPTKSKIIIKLITITNVQNHGSFMTPPTLNGFSEHSVFARLKFSIFFHLDQCGHVDAIVQRFIRHEAQMLFIASF